MSPLRIPHSALTGRRDGMVITDKGKRIGCTVHLANGLWAAWSRVGKIGEYSTPISAERAVYAEAKKPRRP